jgi:hypothetical protein
MRRVSRQRRSPTTRVDPSVNLGLDAERLGTLEAAIDLFPGDDSATRADLLSTLAVELSWPAEAEHRRRELAEEAVDMARRVGDPSTLVRVIARAFHALYAPDTHEQRLRYAMEALALTEGVRDPGLRGLALDRAMWVLIEDGNLAFCDELLVEQQLLADRLGEPVLRFDAALLAATRTMITGTAEESQRALDDLLEVGNHTGMPEVAQSWGTLNGVFSVRRGEIAGFLAFVEDFQRQFPEMDAVKGALASLYCELDRMDEARELLDQATARGLVGLPRDRLLMTSLGHCAGVACALGATDVAAIIYDEFAPYATLFLPPTYGMSEGPVASHLGMLATVMRRFDSAADHSRSADAACRNLGAPYWLARNQMAHARLLLARDEPGDAYRARRLLEEVVEVADREGYEHVKHRAADLLGLSSN